MRSHAASLCQWAASHLFNFSLDIRIKEEEPDPEEWQLSGDSTLNTNDLTHLRVQVVDEEGDQQHQEGKRLRRVACTCPNCKEGGGRYAYMKLAIYLSPHLPRNVAVLVFLKYCMPCHLWDIIHGMTILCVCLYELQKKLVNKLHGIIFSDPNNALQATIAQLPPKKLVCKPVLECNLI